MKKVDLVKDPKSECVEVPKEVIEGRFEIIDELREENKNLKKDNPEVKELKVKNLWLERDYEELQERISELRDNNRILDYADYIHYTVKTNNISLWVSLREQDNGIDRQGTIYRLGLDHNEDREIYRTDKNLLLEDCIREVNEFIRINFKSDLFD